MHSATYQIAKFMACKNTILILKFHGIYSRSKKYAKKLGGYIMMFMFNAINDIKHTHNAVFLYIGSLYGFPMLKITTDIKYCIMLKLNIVVPSWLVVLYSLLSFLFGTNISNHGWSRTSMNEKIWNTVIIMVWSITLKITGKLANLFSWQLIMEAMISSSPTNSQW